MSKFAKGFIKTFGRIINKDEKDTKDEKVRNILKKYNQDVVPSVVITPYSRDSTLYFFVMHNDGK